MDALNFKLPREQVVQINQGLRTLLEEYTTRHKEQLGKLSVFSSLLTPHSSLLTLRSAFSSVLFCFSSAHWPRVALSSSLADLARSGIAEEAKNATDEEALQVHAAEEEEEAVFLSTVS